jgi:hypothetical protein
MNIEQINRGFYDWRESLLKTSLEANTKLVLLVIHTHMNSKSNSAFPSYQTLSNETSLSKRSVILHVKKAVELGWLKKEVRYKGEKDMTSNLYTMVDPTVPYSSIEHHVVPSDEQGGERDSLGGGAGDSLPQCNEFTRVVQEVHPNNPTNNQLNTKTTKKGLQSTIDSLELSEMGVEQEWLEFLEHRKAIKAPMTDIAQKRAFTKLQEFVKLGDDPRSVLTQSIINGWKGLFREKTGGHQNETHQRNNRFASRRAISAVKGNLATSIASGISEETF